MDTPTTNTIEDLRAIYTMVEEIRKPNREKSSFMDEYLRRKGAIAEALRKALNWAQDEPLDQMPENTEIPSGIKTYVAELQDWLDEQNFRKIPANVQAQLDELHSLMEGKPAE